MDDSQSFKQQCLEEIAAQGNNKELLDLSRKWFDAATKSNYSYHFEWLGQPIIQFPQDVIGTQQLLWAVQPDLIIETGIARGGSLIFYASILELIAQCGGPSDARVLGVDIEIRPHNKASILAHPMSKRIDMIEGSSISEETLKKVKEKAQGKKRILVCLDSNHTHDHVLKELQFYAPLVSKGSYMIVFDTVVEDLDPTLINPNRPWKKGDNPKTAVYEFLSQLKNNSVIAADNTPLDFEIDKSVQNQLLITVAPDGFLKRI